MGASGAIKDRIKSLRRVRVSELHAHPKNFRKHGQSQRRAMSAALNEIGFADALLVRKTPNGLQIIDGHLRADLAKDQEVPVLVLDVDEQEAEKLLATFDAITGLAEIDEDILRSLTEGLEFESPDLDELLAGLLGDEPAEIVEDDPPEAQEGPTVAQVGDVWRCGRHRVVCGDAGSAEHVATLLDGAPIHLVNTDPPYNVNVEPRSNNARAAGSNALPAVAKKKAHLQGFDDARHGRAKRTTSTLRAKDRVLANDFMSDEEFDKVLLLWFGNIARALVPGGSFYIWGGYSNWANYPQALKACGLYFSQGITWVKDHPVLGRKDFMNDSESAWYGWREGAGHKFYGPNNARNVWNVTKVSQQSMVHLTEKPVELAARAIEYSSRKRENVLDLFGGSGSTLIACEQLGRRAYLMEIDAMYVDVILQRYMNFTNVSPVRESDGARFAALLTQQEGV